MYPEAPNNAVCALPPRSRVCGSIPGLPAAGTLNHTPILTPDQWIEPTATQRSLIEDVAGDALAQGRFPDCYAMAFVGAYQLTRRMNGLPDVHYSPEQLAAQLGGQTSGWPIDATCEHIMEHGLLPADTIHGDPWRQQSWPDNWKDIARQNRIVEGTDIDDWHGIASFLTLWQTPVAFGYQDPLGGHAIYALYMQRIADRWTCRIMNSWSPNWGDRGRANFSQRDLAAVARYGAIGLRVVTRREDDPSPKPPAPAGV